MRKTVVMIADNFFDPTRLDAARLLDEMLAAVASRSDGALRLDGTAVVVRTGQRWSTQKPDSIWQIPLAVRDLLKFLLDTLPPDHRLVRGAFAEVVMTNAMLGALDANSILLTGDAYKAFRGEPSPLADKLRVASARQPVEMRPPRREVMERLLAYRISYYRVVVPGRDFVDRIRTAVEEGHPAGVILDLRGSPGGLLQSSVDLADLFLAAGPIVTVRGAKTEEMKTAHAEGSLAERIKLAVVVDRDTAAGGEILAGALRFGGRAILVGESTFGNGIIEVVYDFKDRDTGAVSALKLSIAQAVLAGNRGFDGRGIGPDVHVPSPGSPREQKGPGCAPLGEEIATIHRDDPDAAVTVAADILAKSSSAARDDLLAAAKALAGAQQATLRWFGCVPPG